MKNLILTAEPILTIGAALGEGAIWDDEQNLLYWIDIDNCLLNCFDPKTTINKSLKLPAKPGCVVRCATARGGGFILGLPGEFVHLKVDEHLSNDIHTIAVLAKPEENIAGNRMNDGKCDPAGRFWCGSMDLGCEFPSANLWMLDKAKKLTRKLSDITISNGIVWNRAHDTMYHIDTACNRVDAFNFDNESGAISDRRELVLNQWGGHFDGMTIDSDDNLYVAVWGGSAVQKISSKTGQLIATISLERVTNVSSCAFGGENLQDLYITTAQNHEASAEANAQARPEANANAEANAGNLFKIHLSDSQGLPAYQYLG
ncbi:SMP-30/gluconolactonase/LRE family protein [soil metagenome]